MSDSNRERSALVKGAKDIAREVKRQAAKKIGRGSDRLQDEYTGRTYARFQDELDDDYYAQQGSYGDASAGPGHAAGEAGGGAAADDEEGDSDATEGHDEEDEVYEGEYQGIPHGKAGNSHMPAGDGGDPYGDGGTGTIAGLQTEREEMAQQYEAVMQECGHGRFQWTFYMVLGLALMADGVEVFVVAFVLPSAERDLCITDAGKGWLGTLVYLGMMMGSIVWGGLADQQGRRQCLLMALTVNSLFSFLSSFVWDYGTFIFCRFLDGFGIGGIIPIVYSYYAEFLAHDKRGEHLSWLCMTWMFGGIYASAMAWAIIPHYGWSFGMGSAYQFHSWRVFVIVCALPAVASIVCLTFMPESPRHLLEMGKHDEAWMILKRVHDTNMKARGHPEKVFTVTQLKVVKQVDGVTELNSDTGTWHRRWAARATCEASKIWRTFLDCFAPLLRRDMLKLLTIWLTLSFSYYGLSVWFPEVIKDLQEKEYHHHTKVHVGERIHGSTFNFSLVNQIHLNGEFINDKFTNIKLKSVTFEDSLFKNCTFESITSTNTFFKNCTFEGTKFFDTDLFEFKFIGTVFINSSFINSKKGCQIDFSDDFSAYWVYFVSFLGSLAVLPGNIVSALLMDRLGRLKMIGNSMILSGVSCSFLWAGSSEATMIGLLCLFNGLSISAWNALNVITVELFPTNKRTTAFGFLNAMSRLAAVFGNVIFDSTVGSGKTVAVLLASTVLVGGGFVALRMPDTRRQILM
ncbi:synaptic vesicle glycoprotein 2C-like [Lethenteron reissneri]|uniref:synaptic vesicle glycoprotein 2C-like n=1 Tax=Lethenteron reissneri TaxID=7753 RepID=UPI002AB72BD6|nr:synaptic vesicle glycoprotein 2C-like [Lethenteron reissneri]